jgi:hypothetical protein
MLSGVYIAVVFLISIKLYRMQGKREKQERVKEPERESKRNQHPMYGYESPPDTP